MNKDIKYYKNKNYETMYYKLEEDRIFIRYFPSNWFLTTMDIERLNALYLHNRIIEMNEEQLFMELL